jgi:TonB family protein
LNTENKKNIIISLIFHIILIIGLINFKSSNIIVPSRSDGIEVSVLSSNEVAPQAKQIKVSKAMDKVQTLDNSADVNLEQQKTKPTISNKIIQPINTESTNPDTLQQKPPKNKLSSPSQINDLLDDVIANTKTSSKGKNLATTKSGKGSSNNDNMIDSYADLVIQKILPFVIIPDNIDNNASAIVEVTILPNMEVYNIQLIKSSGNEDYDNNIQQAVDRVRIFPDIPAGASFSDYRVLRLTFKPQ